jgi:hypothetical protein
MGKTECRRHRNFSQLEKSKKFSFGERKIAEYSEKLAEISRLVTNEEQMKAGFRTEIASLKTEIEKTDF